MQKQNRMGVNAWCGTAISVYWGINILDCCKCGKKELSGDELAIYRKLVNRGAKEFLCIDCLAELFKCDKSEIEARIKYYRDSGECTLFV